MICLALLATVLEYSLEVLEEVVGGDLVALLDLTLLRGEWDRVMALLRSLVWCGVVWCAEVRIGKTQHHLHSCYLAISRDINQFFYLPFYVFLD